MKRVILAFVLVLSSPSFAGWVSAGGGELFKDAHNPWFLKNVLQVKYCMQVATSSLSTSPAAVKTAVSEALQYWKSEFSRVQSTAAAGKFAVAQQTFTEVPCSNAQIDLRVQVGYETLTTDQIQFLEDPKSFIGVAVRTDYDKNLIGKGFVFIASDVGPNSYHGGTDTTLITQAWSRPALLKYAIMHELGHVFGLPHTGTGLMSETFLEQMLSTSLADAFERMPVETFFSPDDELEFCSIGAVSASAAAFFAVPSGDTCMHLSRKGGTWDVFSRKDKSASLPGAKLGSILAPIPDLSDFHPRPAIVLQLMGNTSLFTESETQFRPFMFGPMLLDYGMKGNFVPLKGVAKPVYVKLSPDRMLVQAATAQKIENLLSYSSPIGILLMKDPTPP